MLGINKKYFSISFVIMFIATSKPLLAQGASWLKTDTTTAFYVVAGLVFVVLLLMLLVLVVLLQVLRYLVGENEKRLALEKGEALPEKESWWTKFLTDANDAVPVEKEETILLDHNYDGIKELDNHLPPWWKWMFYMSIVFSVIYLFVYHVSGSLPLQEAEYNNEIASAKAAMEARKANAPEEEIDEANLELVTDEGQLAKGKRLFVNNCAPCHKESGAGGIGPNLTDDYWLHGGSLADIYRTVKVGVPEKGMISWEPMFSPTQMLDIASYVMTLKGTNPANAKAPQGELFVPEAVEDVEEGGTQSDSIKTEAAVAI